MASIVRDFKVAAVFEKSGQNFGAVERTVPWRRSTSMAC